MSRRARITRRRAAAAATTLLFWLVVFSGYVLAGVDFATWHLAGWRVTDIDWMGSTGAWIIAGNSALFLALCCLLGGD